MLQFRRAVMMSVLVCVERVIVRVRVDDHMPVRHAVVGMDVDVLMRVVVAIHQRVHHDDCRAREHQRECQQIHA